MNFEFSDELKVLDEKTHILCMIRNFQFWPSTAEFRFQTRCKLIRKIQILQPFLEKYLVSPKFEAKY